MSDSGSSLHDCQSSTRKANEVVAQFGEHFSRDAGNNTRRNFPLDVAKL